MSSNSCFHSRFGPVPFFIAALLSLSSPISLHCRFRVARHCCFTLYPLSIAALAWTTGVAWTGTRQSRSPQQVLPVTVADPLHLRRARLGRGPRGGAGCFDASASHLLGIALRRPGSRLRYGPSGGGALPEPRRREASRAHSEAVLFGAVQVGASAAGVAGVGVSRANCVSVW